MTTSQADFPVEAQEKWSWVWKALIFSLFLTLVLRTRLRIEAILLTLVGAAGVWSNRKLRAADEAQQLAAA